MYNGGGRQFSRGGQTQGRRRFRGQYVRSRFSPNRQDQLDDDQYGQQPSSLNSLNQPLSNQYQQNNHHHSQQQSRDQQPSRILNRNSGQHELEDIKEICLKLASELDSVKSRLAEISSNLEQMRLQQRHQPVSTSQNHAALAAATTTTTTTTTNDNSNKRKTKLLRRRNKSERDQQNSLDGGDQVRGNERLDKKRRNQELKEKPLPLRTNDDSTTQAADPSSEDRVEGENGGERVKRVIRRRKPNLNRRGYNRRNRGDSSERNSNDTSPQNEVDDEDYRRPQKARNGPKNVYPELTESEMNEITQAMCRDFFASDMGAVDKTVLERSPAVVKAFATAILEHAICDVTSPTKLSEIAINLSQAVVGIEAGRKFERGLYSALTELAKREDDIVIDAPRYMDTLGQLLGQCLIPLNTGRNKPLMRDLLKRSVIAYGKKSGHKLFASILKAVASCKSESVATQMFEQSNLFFNSKVWNEEFLESQDIKFLSKQQSSSEPREPKVASEKLVDEITRILALKTPLEKVEGYIKDLQLGDDDVIHGTLMYAIVRGCLVIDSEKFKLDAETLNKYSALMKNQQYKQEQQDAIALHALTAIAKFWHQNTCVQSFMTDILSALHGNGVVSHGSLKTWLTSDDLKSAPGIESARLESKQLIESLAEDQS